jgi:hypothetical protein
MLALRAKKPARPNTDYVAQLYTFYGTMVSASFISLWFKTRFDHKGSFRKPNLVTSGQVLARKCNPVRQIQVEVQYTVRSLTILFP